jgi:hypothetical protein
VGEDQLKKKPGDGESKMKKFVCALGICLASCFSDMTMAAAVGTVDGVQLPAWLDRAGLTVPISPGIFLQAGDTVRTGAGARLLLKLDEGSFVKLGENAKFVIERAQPRKGVFEAALNVLNGAFRFTTVALSRSMRRDVRIRVGQNATVGIRGTDLWGRSRDDNDIVCLIEGKIEITGNDKKPLMLDQPLQLFQSTSAAAPAPISFLSKPELDVFAAETELELGKTSSPQGGWKVVIDGFASRAEAREAARNLRNNGYPVEVATDNSLIIAKMDSELSARQLATRLKAGSGFKEVRIAQ